MIMETIKKVIEKETKLSLSVRSRKREYLFARALYYKLCKEETAYSLQKIGELLSIATIHYKRFFPNVASML